MEDMRGLAVPFQGLRLSVQGFWLCSFAVILKHRRCLVSLSPFLHAENLNRLFQFFTQLDDRLSREYEGIGIGLALVQRLTELHGGYITVESQVGQGSCFTVNIPV